MTVDGAPWAEVDGRLVEVEGYVDHDAAMDSWERLDAGIALLGRTHAVLRGVETGAPGRRAPFANHVEPAEVVAATRRGAARIRGWGPTAPEASLAAAAEELAARVAEAEAALAVRPPRQLVHGDFWDNNVLFLRGRIVLVGDLEFMGERARVDDLALTLWFAEADLPPAPGLAARLARLRRLLGRYDAGADPPLSAAERAALPLALARQPLWSIGGWVARLDDQAAARRHAAGTERSVRAALGLMDDLDHWREALA
jgi:homoserine kinase type II